MSFRFFPQALAFAGACYFLIRAVLIFAEGRIRVPLSDRKMYSGPLLKFIAWSFITAGIACAVSFVYLLFNPPWP